MFLVKVSKILYFALLARRILKIIIKFSSYMGKGGGHGFTCKFFTIIEKKNYSVITSQMIDLFKNQILPLFTFLSEVCLINSEFVLHHKL